MRARQEPNGYGDATPRQMYRLARDNVPSDPQSGEWHYPASERVLEEVGLHAIEHYIDTRRQVVANYIVKNEPIFELCRSAERLRVTSAARQWCGSNLWT